MSCCGDLLLNFKRMQQVRLEMVTQLPSSSLLGHFSLEL